MDLIFQEAFYIYNKVYKEINVVLYYSNRDEVSYGTFAYWTLDAKTKFPNNIF
jgi:hypothetical protein